MPPLSIVIVVTTSRTHSHERRSFPGLPWHAVLPANDPQSGIFRFNVGRTCGECHGAIAAKYGASVHGKARALGRSPTRPEFGRFSYAEKAEYWAGLWGTVIMSITGLMIWYSVAVATWIPRWWIDIATTIHFHEAILALAIIVWHLYRVIFDPDVYPMNWAWFDGKMSEHLYREEHGLEAKKTLDKEIESGA